MPIFFANPKYLQNYQDGFLRKELISGEAGKEGAVSKMFYKYRKREMVLTETIITNRLPHSFEANYHHKHMDNSLKSTFSDLNENQTRFAWEGEYTAFRGFIPKLMVFFFPKMFEKQAQKWMNNFKEFVEKQ